MESIVDKMKTKRSRKVRKRREYKTRENDNLLPPTLTYTLPGKTVTCQLGDLWSCIFSFNSLNLPGFFYWKRENGREMEFKVELEGKTKGVCWTDRDIGLTLQASFVFKVFPVLQGKLTIYNFIQGNYILELNEFWRIFFWRILIRTSHCYHWVVYQLSYTYLFDLWPFSV